MRRLHRPGVIGQANERVPITSVLASLGVLVAEPPPSGVSIKIECPFSFLHPPGKDRREMRLYSDGKAYCHICVTQYDSVSMAAQAWGCSQLVAAQRLLAGQEVATERRVSKSMYASRAAAVAALGEWADANGVDRFSATYARCLTVADAISTEEQVGSWLRACKRVLTRSNG
jgi:hypothetical protein